MFFLFQNAHLALIDCLMQAYISETVSVEKIVQAVRYVVASEKIAQSVRYA